MPFLATGIRIGSARLACAALVLAACGSDEPQYFSGSTSSCPHEVDGLFTGWPDCSEYALSMPGVYGDLYLDYADDTLYVLNDWFVRDDAPVNDDAYNLFELSTGDGTELWDVRVYGDGRTEVLREGERYDGGVEGAHAFARSPEHDFDHALFEFALLLSGDASEGAFTMKEKDPAPGTVPPGVEITEEEADDALMEEPTLASGVLTGTAATLEEASGPRITQLVPAVGAAGDKIDIRGHQFGTTQGEVEFGTHRAEIVSWSDELVIAVVPAGVGAGSVEVRAYAEGEGSNPVTFGCAPVCEAGACGTDGCGGTCECPTAQHCEGSKCVCTRSCDGKTCGSDGCGGVCGTCEAGAMCESGSCCTPQCDGKTCGPNGCGGVCGECSSPNACVAGCCTQCDARDRGMPDGCGGVCN